MNLNPAENDSSYEKSSSLRDAVGGDYFEPSLQAPFGLISTENVISLKRKGTHKIHKQIVNLLSKNDLDSLRKLLFTQNFFSDYVGYVESGELPYLLLKQNEYSLMKESLDYGFPFPTRLLIKAIEDNELGMISTIIRENLYSNNNIELAFYLMIENNMIEQAKMLVAKEEKISRLSSNFILELKESIMMFLNSLDIVSTVLKCALNNKEDLIACNLLIKYPRAIDPTCIKIALNNYCIETLEVIWTGNLVPPSDIYYPRAKKCIIWDKLNMDITDKLERKKINRMMRINNILQAFVSSNQLENAEKVLRWPDACNESGIVRVLISEGQEDLLLKHIKITKLEFTSTEFLEAFDKGYYKACVKMLRSKEPRSVLIKEKIQKKLIEMLEDGQKCFYAISILGFINVQDWNADLTKSLCVTLDDLISTTEEIFVCPSPLLFCALSVEFLTKLSLNSALNKHRCLECADLYLNLSKHIQEDYKDDEVLKFLLMDTDCRGRSTLMIIAENNMLDLLEDLSVGGIIDKLWKGSEFRNIWDASSIFCSIFYPESFLAPADRNSPYSFSLSIWKESCMLRYFASNFYILFLLVVYNALIIEGVANNNFIDLSTVNSTDSLLRLSQILIFSMMCDLLIQIIYCAKVGTTFKFDGQRLTEIAIFGMMILVLADLQKNMGPGKEYPSADPEIFNGMMHSLINVLIWVRFLLILITTKTLGPFLYMIYSIMHEMLTFYFLFACFTIWFAAVFTALFSTETPGSYGDFFTSFITLYTATLAPQGFNNFGSKNVLGGLFLGLYLILTNIILLNLFIALFTTIYDEIREKVDSTFRSVLVRHYETMKWDEKYGSLIILPSPFSFISLIFTPFLIRSNNPLALSNKIIKYFYVGIVGIAQYLIFLLISIVSIPFTYFVGFFNFPYHSLSGPLPSESHYSLQEVKFSTKKFVIWVFGGPFIMFYQIYKDSKIFWEAMFTEQENFETMHPFVTRENIEAFYETLNSLDAKEITNEELATVWSYTKSLLTYSPESDKELQSATEFFGFFASSSKNRMINVVVLKKLFENIDKTDLERIDKVRIPYLHKASYNYKNLLGGVDIEGTVLPKKLGTPGGPVDVTNVKVSNKILIDLSAQFEYFENVIQKVKKHLNNA